jgi:hypothetical protein
VFVRWRVFLELKAAVLELRARVELHSTHMSTLQNRLSEFEKRLDGTVPAVLRAELDDLRTAIEVDRITHRKQLGKLWGRVGRDERADEPSRPMGAADPELQAFLDLQGNTRAQPPQ